VVLRLRNLHLIKPLRYTPLLRDDTFIGFNVDEPVLLTGTIFQVGALPLVVLGPLGAVSLLYNAFFARVLLGDHFSVQLVAGQ